MKTGNQIRTAPGVASRRGLNTRTVFASKTTQNEDTVTQTSAPQSSKQAADKNAIRPFRVNVPEAIKTLVYVSACLPKDGQSLLELGNSDKDSKIGPHLQIMKDKGIIAVEKSARADLFCLDCNDQLREAIPNLIVDEPLAPLATPVHLTADRFGTVDKIYIHTAKDQVVSPSLQAIMVAATPVRKEITIDTGHTPFLTDPDGLARGIEMAAKPQDTASR
jgi:hypothetical protein